MTKILIPKAQITLLMDGTGKTFIFIPPTPKHMKNAWEATRPREERDAQR